MLGGKTRWELHKNVSYCFQQILEATSHKTAALQPLTRVYISVGWPAKTYIHLLCADTGCSLEDLPGAVNNRDGWWESRDSVLSAWFDDYKCKPIF